MFESRTAMGSQTGRRTLLVFFLKHKFAVLAATLQAAVGRARYLEDVGCST